MTAFFNDGRYAENEKESSKGDHRAFVCGNGLFPHGRYACLCDGERDRAGGADAGECFRE